MQRIGTPNISITSQNAADARLLAWRLNELSNELITIHSAFPSLGEWPNVLIVEESFFEHWWDAPGFLFEVNRPKRRSFIQEYRMSEIWLWHPNEPYLKPIPRRMRSSPAPVGWLRTAPHQLVLHHHDDMTLVCSGSFSTRAVLARAELLHSDPARYWEEHEVALRAAQRAVTSHLVAIDTPAPTHVLHAQSRD